MSPSASSSRPLALAMRKDLVVRQQRWQGREYWIIKDPLALKYYRFENEEFAILSMLDGRTSSDTVRERFERQFAPQRLSAAALQRLLAMLHRSNLLVADAPGQGDQLLARRNDRERQARRAAAANFLAIRCRGVNPDRFLTWLDRRTGWLFSLPAALAAAALVLAAMLLVGSEFDTFCARLPGFRAFFAAQNWLWLAAVMCCTKVLHELGHGLACKRFGGQCHEMGVMLLVFTPCLYCNVSDVWMIPSRWRRAAVGAAGMYVELILASLATFLWWYSAPGLFHHLCLNVMFVSSVSTLLVNANPLMRFDGYYILADLLEVPNLRQKSAAVIQRALARRVLGLRLRPDPFLPPRRQWLFAAYAIASSVYMWLVSLSIFWFLYRVLEPYGLKLLGQLLGAAMLVSLVVMPGVRIVHFVMEPARNREVNKMRAVACLGLAGAAVAAVLALPLPYSVTATFEVQPRDAVSVYVDVPGELREIGTSKGKVEAGDLIARLDNLELRGSAERLQARRAALVARIDSIRQRAHTDDAALLELAQLEEGLAALDRQLRRVQQDIDKLTIRAPAAGCFVPPPARAAGETGRGQLTAWTGRPLDGNNVRAFLEAGTLLGRIAQPGAVEAILAIDQTELDFVREGNDVRLMLVARPGTRLAGRIARIAEQNMEIAPVRLAARAGGQLGTQTSAGGLERPLSVVYQASVPLDDPTASIVVGATGQARIHAGYQPLAKRLWRAACRTFHFEL